MKLKVLFMIFLLGVFALPTLSIGLSFKNQREYLSYGPRIPILSKGMSSQKQMLNFILSKNKNIDADIVNYIAKSYIEECATEGINHDIAFSQMALETNFLQFGHTVYAYQNNFAGIGTVSEVEQGGAFNTIYMGIRAHIQHLVSYASKENNPHTPIVDPRFSYVVRGSAPLLGDLSGKWAADKQYGSKIFDLIVRLVETSTTQEYSDMVTANNKVMNKNNTTSPVTVTKDNSNNANTTVNAESKTQATLFKAEPDSDADYDTNDSENNNNESENNTWE